MNFLETREAILAQIGDNWTGAFDLTVEGVTLKRMFEHLEKLVESGRLWKRIYVRSITASEFQYCRPCDVGDPPIGKRERTSKPMRRTWARAA